MGKSLNFCLSMLVTALVLTDCQSPDTLYRKIHTPEEQKKLAIQLIDGRGGYYQGAPGHQLILQEALSLDSTNADVWRELGVAYLKRGFASQFPHYYGKAADINPLSWQGWRGYLYLYFYRDYERALADFNATDILTPDIVDYPQSISVDYMRGICHLQLGAYQTSIDFFQKHIDYESKTVGWEYIEPITFLLKGIAAQKAGQSDLARAAFEEGNKLDPSNADLLYQLGKLHLQSGELGKAHQLLQQAKTQWLQGNFNQRPYVEEFYQTYLEDIEVLLPEKIRR